MTATDPAGAAAAPPGGEGVSPEEFLDTNPVVRYLVRDDPDLAARATALIESDRRLFLSVVTAAEIGSGPASTYRRLATADPRSCLARRYFSLEA